MRLYVKNNKLVPNERNQMPVLIYKYRPGGEIAADRVAEPEWELLGQYPDTDSLKAMGEGGEYAVLESTGERDDGLPTGFGLSEIRPVKVETDSAVTLGRKRALDSSARSSPHPKGLA